MFRFYCQAYEEQCMYPTESNSKVARLTMEEIVYRAPEAFGLRALARRIAICFLDERVRIAMMYASRSSLSSIPSRLCVLTSLVRMSKVSGAACRLAHVRKWYAAHG